MKRSKTLVLTTMITGAGVTLSACEPAVTGGGDIGGEPVQASSFTSVAECKAGGAVPPAECDRAYAQAQAANEQNAPQYAARQSCEEQHGVGECQPRNNGSFFSPLLTGFIVGQALSNFGGGYRGAPMYRNRDGSFIGGGGGRLTRDYATGRSVIGSNAFDASARAPARVQSRSAVVSRGGFGGFGGRGFGG